MRSGRVTPIESFFFLSELVKNNGEKYSIKKTSNIKEYQLILGINWYRFEIRKPKLIRGVADPLIINSGEPV